MCSNSSPNFKAIRKCTHNYSKFKVSQKKKKKKNAKKIRQNLKEHISKMAWLIFNSNSKLEVPQPEEICTEKFVCFCPENIELQMQENGVFIFSCKMHTCLSRTQCLLSCVLISCSRNLRNILSQCFIL